jgi:hypothetical protein
MYYEPLESILITGQYTSVCRMPGLLPVYLPLRIFFTSAESRQVIIPIQYLLDALSCLLICIIAARLYGSQQVFHLTAIVLALSSFVVIRCSYLLSDSLMTSVLILSLFLLVKFIDKQRTYLVFLVGTMLCWAIFLRQITIIIIPVYGLIIWFGIEKSRTRRLAHLFALLLPIVLALTLWTSYNYARIKRPIVLVAPLEECMTQISPAYSSIRTFIITTGKDFQPWRLGDAAHWFTDPNEKLKIPYSQHDLASAYTLDSLQTLKNNYQQLLLTPKETARYDSLSSVIITSANRFGKSYVLDHPVRYYFVNRINFMIKLLFPSQIDDLPFPARAEMNILQKAIKGWSLVLLSIVSGLTLLALLYHSIKMEWPILLWLLTPISFLFVLSFFGYIEQRFLVPSYPFMVMISVGFLHRIFSREKANVPPY